MSPETMQIQPGSLLLATTTDELFFIATYVLLSGVVPERFYQNRKSISPMLSFIRTCPTHVSDSAELNCRDIHAFQRVAYLPTEPLIRPRTLRYAGHLRIIRFAP